MNSENLIQINIKTTPQGLVELLSKLLDLKLVKTNEFDVNKIMEYAREGNFDFKDYIKSKHENEV